MRKHAVAVLLAAAATVAGFAPAASADPWPLCSPVDQVQFCVPICFGTHDNYQCIPDVE